MLCKQLFNMIISFLELDRSLLLLAATAFRNFPSLKKKSLLMSV